MSENKEKIYIAAIIFLLVLSAYLAFFRQRKIEINFSKPVSPIGNSTAPERPDIWGNKQ